MSADALSIPLLGPSLLRFLDRTVTGLILFAAALRPFSMGQPANEVETTWISSLVWLAAFLWLLRSVSLREWPVPRGWVWVPLGAYTFFSFLAVLRVWYVPFAGLFPLEGEAPFGDGNGQAAWDMGMAVAADLLLLFVVANHFQTRERMRLLLAVFFAGCLAVSAYSVYQWAYELDYFRLMTGRAGNNVSLIAGRDPLHQTLFQYRLASERIYGPFAYPNALAGYLLLLLPFGVGLWAETLRGRAGQAKKKNGDSLPTWPVWCLRGGLVLGVMVFASTESKGGFLAAKVAECMLLLLLCRKKHAVLSLQDIANVIAGIACATLGCAILVFGAWAAGVPRTWLPLFFGLTWVVEWCVLAAYVSERRVPRGVRWGGLASFLAGGALVVWLLGGWGVRGNTDGLAGRAASVHQAVRKQMDVRLNYWRAAIAMAADHPWRGVGLDNFGSRYTQYKTPKGWAVRRAHNHYLQLLADGGVPLVLSFLVLIGSLAWGGMQLLREEKIEYESAETPLPVLTASRVGLVICAGVFGCIYLMYLRGFFGGLAVEYFFHELFAIPGKGSLRAEFGTWGACIVHGVTHFFLLPFIWLVGFWSVWRLCARIDLRWIITYVGVGVAGLLLHGAVDFHLQVSSVSFFLWGGMGLLIAERGGLVRTVFLSRRRASFLLIFILIVGGWMLWRVPFRCMEGSFLFRAADLHTDMCLAERDSDKRFVFQKDALDAVGKAVALRPRDGALYRLKGKLLAVSPEMVSAFQRNRVEPYAFVVPDISQEICGVFLKQWALVIRCDPYFASGYAMMAQDCLRMKGNTPTVRAKAIQLLEKAIVLHPWKARHRLELGNLFFLDGDKRAARSMLESAQVVDEAVTDERAHLSEKEKQSLQWMLRRLSVLGSDHN